MFQKRHYEFLAAWLRDLSLCKGVKDTVLLSLMCQLKNENVNFKPEKFREWVLNGKDD